MKQNFRNCLSLLSLLMFLLIGVGEAHADNTAVDVTKYRLVTSESQLVEGQRYVIACNTKGKLLGKANEKNRGVTDVRFADDKSGIVDVIDGDVYTFVLQRENNAWHLFSELDRKFLYRASDGLKQNDEKVDRTQLSISISENGDATLSFNGIDASVMNLKYNASSKLFNIYSTAQTAVQLYVYDNVHTRNTAVGSFGTLCLPCAVPADGVQGAICYAIEGKVLNADNSIKELSLVAVGGALEAGKPYIFKATAAQQSFAQVGEAVVEAGKNGGLVGTFAKIDVAEGYYLLSNSTIVQCGKGCSVGANRAYINMADVPLVSRPVGMRVIVGNGGTSGIDVVEGESASERTYDLSGRPVSRHYKGVRIVKGKKTISK